MRKIFISIFSSAFLFACSDSSSSSTVSTPPEEEIATEPLLPFIGNAPAIFSEIAPENISLKDFEGDDPAWIEFFNPSAEEVNLAGFYLTNSLTEPKKWQFGDTKIAPYSCLLVFLSGKDLPDFIAPSDSINMVGTGFWSWDDSQNAGVKGESYVKPFAFSTLKKKNEKNSYNFSAEIKYGENEDLGWHSASLFVGTGNSSKNDTKDISKTNELLLTGFINKGVQLNLKLAQPDVDDWKGFGKTITGTGDSLTTYRIILPQNTTFPDLKNIYGTRFAPDENEMQTLQFTFYSYIARNHGHAPHASFKIKNTGGSLYLTNGTAILDSVNYPKIPKGKTWSNASGSFGFADATPEAGNNEPIYTSQADTLTLPPSGFYADSFWLQVAMDSTDVFRCETGGKLPTETSNLIETAPILINKTTVLRCTNFKDGFYPSEVVSRTYLFEEKSALPVVFLTGDPDSWFSPDTGIYMDGPNAQEAQPHYGANYWLDKELPIFVEFFEPTSLIPDFSENAGYSIFGNYSRVNPKKSAAITFKEKYGKTRLNYRLFPEHPELSKFKVFLLRNNGGNFYNDYIRDRLASSLSKGLGVDYQKARPCVVYYNGEYFGIHNIRERSTEYYFETNYDLNPESIDLLKADNSATKGSSAGYIEMISFLETNNVQDSLIYNQLQEMMDVDNFINYMQIELFANNRDWPGNNLKKWRSNAPLTKWKWFLYDLDWGFGCNFSSLTNNIFEFATTENGESWPNGPEHTFLLRTLLTNEKFKAAFINRFPVLISTYYSSETITKKIDALMNEIASEIPKDQERWNLSASKMERELETIYNFAKTRPSVILEEMQEFFELGKTTSVTLSTSGNGSIAVHGLVIPKSSLTVPFFENFPVLVEAVPSSNSVFSAWSDGNTSKIRIINPGEIQDLKAVFK